MANADESTALCPWHVMAPLTASDRRVVGKLNELLPLFIIV